MDAVKEGTAVFQRLLDVAKTLPIYNFRQYFGRIARDDFGRYAAEADVAKRAVRLAKAKELLSVLERQSAVEAMYVKQRSVMEDVAGPKAL